MNAAQLLFYLLATVTVLATLLAITEKHPVHAIVYLVTSFFALATIFFLLAAPLIAIFEVIIYAGAVMVLFMFVIMMLDLGRPEQVSRPGLLHWLPAIILSATILAALATLLEVRAGSSAPLPQIGVKAFCVTLFRGYGLAIEIISLDRKSVV